jgi:hypothetical protein
LPKKSGAQEIDRVSLFPITFLIKTFFIIQESIVWNRFHRLWISCHNLLLAGPPFNFYLRDSSIKSLTWQPRNTSSSWHSFCLIIVILPFPIRTLTFLESTSNLAIPNQVRITLLVVDDQPGRLMMKCLCKSYFPYKLSLILLGILCFLFGLPGSPMMSPVYADDGLNDGAAMVVTTTADKGPGSLRHALLHAPSGASITFSVTGTILLESSLVIFNKDLTITGPGPDRLRIDGGNRSRLITVRNGPDSGLPRRW